MDESIFLANIIFIFHLGVVLFVLLAPFTKIPALLILHITFCVSLLVHWYTSSDVCSLTLLEGHLRGIERDSTFTHKLISPMYNISETNSNMIAYIITYTMMFISIYYLYNSEEVKIAFDNYDNSDGGFKNLFKSFGPLLVIKTSDV